MSSCILAPRGPTSAFLNRQNACWLNFSWNSSFWAYGAQLNQELRNRYSIVTRVTQTNIKDMIILYKEGIYNHTRIWSISSRWVIKDEYACQIISYGWKILRVTTRLQSTMLGTKKESIKWIQPLLLITFFAVPCL